MQDGSRCFAKNFDVLQMRVHASGGKKEGGSAMQVEEMWTYGRFEPGQSFGVVEVPMDATKRARWQTIFGPSADQTLPRGMLVAAMMEAYIRAIQPRPKGNIHAAQALDFTSHKPRWNDMISIAVSCLSKEDKKGRYWVDFGIKASAGDKMVLSGTIRSIWAQ
jgi:hypothetical protein